MIKVIFEDHEQSNIAKLFRASFNRKSSGAFIYARGCGEIKRRIEECLTEEFREHGFSTVKIQPFEDWSE